MSRSAVARTLMKILSNLRDLYCSVSRSAFVSADTSRSIVFRFWMSDVTVWSSFFTDVTITKS